MSFWRNFTKLERNGGVVCQCLQASRLTRTPCRALSIPPAPVDPSSPPTQTSGNKFYELRTYNIKPSKYFDIMKLNNDKFHLRMAYSKLVGYWTTELGGLNELVSLFEYDNYSHRSEVRKSLAADEQWINEYLISLLKSCKKQENVVMNLFPWSTVRGPEQEGGVYELQYHQMSAGGAPRWGDALKYTVDAIHRTGYSALVGAWCSEFGPANSVYLLWHFNDLDERALGKRRKNIIDLYMAKSLELTANILTTHSKVLVPTPFSPLK